MTLIEQLTRLAEIAPEICSKPRPNRWVIGDCQFDFRDDVIVACLISRRKYVSGCPALAWLRDALEQVIEARGWDYEHRYFAPIGNIGPRHKVMIMNGRDAGHIADTKTDALLAALIAALEEGKG